MKENDVRFQDYGPFDAHLSGGTAPAAAEPRYQAGDRVAFTGSLEALLAYPHPPSPGAQGTVARVRSAGRTAAYHGGRVWVRWDAGSACSLMGPGHLERVASAGPQESYRRVVASLGDLGGFMRAAGADDTLVHKATRDLWSVREEDGQYVIERLFDADGAPLKV